MGRQHGVGVWCELGDRPSLALAETAGGCDGRSDRWNDRRKGTADWSRTGRRRGDPRDGSDSACAIRMYGSWMPCFAGFCL